MNIHTYIKKATVNYCRKDRMLKNGCIPKKIGISFA